VSALAEWPQDVQTSVSGVKLEDPSG